MPPTDDEPHAPAETPRSAGNHAGPRDRSGSHPFLTMLIMLALLAVGAFIAIEFSDAAKLQDCVQSGRRNCAPIEGDPGAH